MSMYRNSRYSVLSTNSFFRMRSAGTLSGRNSLRVGNCKKQPVETLSKAPLPEPGSTAPHAHHVVTACPESAGIRTRQPEQGRLLLTTPKLLLASRQRHLLDSVKYDGALVYGQQRGHRVSGCRPGRPLGFSVGIDATGARFRAGSSTPDPGSHSTVVIVTPITLDRNPHTRGA